MTERIPCQTAGCKATILPATAAKTGGICMPCFQEKERQARQAYIEQHRQTVNLYEGVTDPVAILQRMHAPKKHDPLIQYVPYPLSPEQIYVALSAEEAGQMLEYAAGRLEAGEEDVAEEILLSLLCYRNADLAEVLPVLAERGMYQSSILFKDAPPAMRDSLLQEIESNDDDRNLLLLILGWIGDEAVVSKFRKWRQHPPLWKDKLYAAPETYAREGGWELSPGGARRSLTNDVCYAIRQGGDLPGEAADVHAERFLTEGHFDCPWCGRKVTSLIDVNTSHPSLEYLRLPLDRLQVATCWHCGAFSHIYMALDAHGTPVWSSYNQRPDYLPEPEDAGSSDGPVSGLSLAAEPQSPFYAAAWVLNQKNSQIGGHPGWVQDAEYPDCPCCGTAMVFIGQLDSADFEEYGEGIYYMFICTEDQLTATVYQQS